MNAPHECRQRAEGDLGWRPAGSHADGEQQWPPGPGREGRTITDDFSANGAFLSHGESRQRLGEGLSIDTLRIHDADTVRLTLELVTQLLCGR